MANVVFIVGIVLFVTACFVSVAVYLRFIRYNSDSVSYTHHMPDMRWYSEHKQLWNATLSTFYTCTLTGVAITQIVCTARVSDDSEMKAISPFTVALGPLIVASVVPVYRYNLATSIKEGATKWSLLMETLSLFIIMASLIIWLFQYTLAVYDRHDNELASFLFALASTYSILWFSLLYWVYTVPHFMHTSPTIVVAADMAKASSLTTTNKTETTDTSMNPFSNFDFSPTKLFDHKVCKEIHQ